MNPYSAYRPSGVEWLGDVPEHWEVRPLKALLSKNDSGVWGDDPEEEDVRSTIVLRSTEQTVDGGWAIEAPATRMLSPRARAGALLKVGDLVVTKSSGSEFHIGKTSLVTVEVSDLNACFSNFMQRLRCRSGFDPRLVWYLLNSPVGRQQLVFSSNTTTGLANLNGTIFGEVVTPVPPVDEQRVIAAFLDRETERIDALVAKNRQLTERLQEYRTALITRTVTRGLPPDAAITAGLDPSPRLKPSGVKWLGDVPEHWEVGNIRRYAEMKSGHTPSRQHPEYWEDCDIPWFTLSDVWQLRDGRATYLDETRELISHVGIANSAAALLPAGSVILSRTASIGFSGIMPVPMATSQDFWNWVCGPKLTPKYLLLTFRSMHSEFNRLMRGSTHRTIYEASAASFCIPVPPTPEQQAIVEFLEERLPSNDAALDAATRAIERLQEYRTALITAAVTGKVDVREPLAADGS